MSSSPPSLTFFLQDYAPPPGVYDEFVAGDGTVRPHLRSFVEAVNRVGQEEFDRRWSHAQRDVHENGFAYSGHGDGSPRPWELDAIPLLVPSAEWSSLSRALTQRAEVLNQVLQDLYGTQTLLKQGILPPELVYSHPGYLRAYHDPQRAHDRYLDFYSADLARSSDGSWSVLADRTEAPSGLGYALENRIVVSRMLPDVFQHCQVQRLAPFFMAAQETLRGQAHQHRENPHLVLLSHGPTSPNYFEDAYLARYLGYTLVEGGDLAVRNAQIFLKTLGGLTPIDVILRRQNSDDCDPLALDAHSPHGVAGLVEATRSGNVGIANSLGSGLVESPAFMSFIPTLCRSLLGEDLLLPGVTTWWCGDKKALSHVLANLENLIIQPAFRRRGKDGPTREMLNALSESELRERLTQNPVDYVAHERAVRSSMPVWREPTRPAHLAMRTYLVAADDSYQVMPGALARISSSLDPLEVSIRRGEGSKDVWVLADSPVEHVSLLSAPGHTLTLRRSGAELPSRLADNIFWLGRQLERAESSARLIRSSINRMIGETRSTSDLELPVLLRCLADQGQIEPDYAVDVMSSQLQDIEQVLPRAVFDENRAASLRSVVNELYRLGAAVRDRMSQDNWRIIRRIDENFWPARIDSADLPELLGLTDELITSLGAFCGLVHESMTRTHGFRFLELGRRLERSWQLISLLKNCFVPLPEVQTPIFETVLEVGDSLMTYRSRYLADLQMSAVLDLLVTDETNPRSLAYQFVQLAEHIEGLPQTGSPVYTSEQRLAMALLHSVRMIDVQLLADSHGLGDYAPLQNLLASWETNLPQFYEALSHRYFVHAVPAHQLAEISPQ